MTQGDVETLTDKNTRLLSSNLDFLFGNLPALFNKMGGLRWFATSPDCDVSSRNHLLLSVCYHRNIVLSPEEFVNLLYVNSFVMETLKTHIEPEGDVEEGAIDEYYKQLISNAKIYTPEIILVSEGSVILKRRVVVVVEEKTRKVKRVRNKLHTRRKNVHISNNNTRKHLLSENAHSQDVNIKIEL